MSDLLLLRFRSSSSLGDDLFSSSVAVTRLSSTSVAFASVLSSVDVTTLSPSVGVVPLRPSDEFGTESSHSVNFKILSVAFTLSSLVERRIFVGTYVGLTSTLFDGDSVSMISDR